MWEANPYVTVVKCMSEKPHGITTVTNRGERAPEACILAEHLQEYDVDAVSMPTGDHALYVAEDDLDAATEQALLDSHYVRGLPRTATESEGYVGWKPAPNRHIDR